MAKKKGSSRKRAGIAGGKVAKTTDGKLRPGAKARGNSREAKPLSAPPSHDFAEREPYRRFPIVGIGASAGGLEACSQLLNDLPEKPGMALVVVQHLAPKHHSILPDLLRSSSH